MNLRILTEGLDQLGFDESRLSDLVETGLLQPDSLVWFSSRGGDWQTAEEALPDLEFTERADFGLLPNHLADGEIICGECDAHNPIEKRRCWLCNREIWAERGTEPKPPPITRGHAPPPLSKVRHPHPSKLGNGKGKAVKVVGVVLGSIAAVVGGVVIVVGLILLALFFLIVEICTGM